MKKRFLLFAAIGAMGTLIFSSYEGGPALSGQIRNGVNGSVTNCGGSGCHGTATTGTTAAIRVDSAGGVQVSRYVPGMTYTVTVSGTNTTGLSNFGFQYSAVSGATSARVQAGSFSGLPTGVVNHPMSGVGYVEQTTALAGASGNFSKSFQWVAPSAGAGAVTMYLTVNAVNNNNSADASDVSGNTSISLTQLPSASVGSVNNASFRVYPNPVASTLNIQLSNATYGTYDVAVYDLMGKQVAAQTVEVTGANAAITLDAANWAAGAYNAVVAKEGSRQVIQVVKQ